MRRAVLADGIFELLLGIAFVFGPWAGLALPPPASIPVTVGVGLMLLLVGVALWRLAGRLNPRQVVGLALINGLGAVVFTTWLFVSWSRFTPTSSALIMTTAAGLAILSIVELAGEWPQH